MKKHLLGICLTLVMIFSMCTACSGKKDGTETSGSVKDSEPEEVTKVTLNEVAHSIFYAPMYVAIEEKYFEDEGIDLDLVCGFGVRRLGQDIL